MAEDSLDAWGLGYADEDSQHGTRAWRGSHEAAQSEETRNKHLRNEDRDAQHAVTDLHRRRNNRDAGSDRDIGNREGKHTREEQRRGGEGERRRISTTSANRGDSPHSQRSSDSTSRSREVRDDRCDRKSGGSGRAKETSYSGEQRGHGTDGSRHPDASGQAETKCADDLHERRSNHDSEHRSSSTTRRGDTKDVESKNGMRSGRQDRDSHRATEREREDRSGGSQIDAGRERGRSVERTTKSSEKPHKKPRAADAQDRDERQASASRSRSEAIRDGTKHAKHTGHERQTCRDEDRVGRRESESREKGSERRDAEMEARRVETEVQRGRDCSAREMELRRGAEKTEREKEVTRESERRGKKMEPRREGQSRSPDMKARRELGGGLDSARGVTTAADAGGERQVQGTHTLGSSWMGEGRARQGPSIVSSRAGDEMGETQNGDKVDDLGGEKRIYESRGAPNIRQERGHGERNPYTGRPQASAACERRAPPTVDREVGIAAGDVTLDFTHELFDAAKALRTRGLKPPYPDVCPIVPISIHDSERNLRVEFCSTQLIPLFILRQLYD